MKQQEEIKRILNEYCTDSTSSNNVKEWVRSVLSFNISQTNAMYRGGGSIAHLNCWVIYDPSAETFFIARTDTAASARSNGVRLALEDYLSVSYGVHSLHNMKAQLLMSTLELDELSNTVAEDVHAWCTLLDSTAAAPKP